MSDVSPESPPPSSELRAKLALLGVSIFIALLICEVAVRLWFGVRLDSDRAPDVPYLSDYAQPSEHPELHYQLKPGIDVLTWGDTRVLTDEWGHTRVGERHPVHEVPEFKLAIVGDSTSFGWKVQYEESYGEVLRGLLEERTGRKVEVRNFSVPGYNSLHNRVTTRDRVMPWNPDLIVLHYDHNDADLLFEVPPQFLPPEYGDNFLNSRFLKLLSRRIRGARNKDMMERASDQPGHPNKFYKSYRVAGPDYDAHIEEVRALRKDAGETPVLAFVFNIWIDAQDDFVDDLYYTLLHEPLVPRLDAMGYDVVDSYPVFQQLLEERDEGDLSFFWSSAVDGHPNPEGHRFIAELLADEIIERRYVATPD